MGTTKPAVASGKQSTGPNPIDLFTAKVEVAMEGGLSRRDAVCQVAAQHPKLHARFVEASNGDRSIGQLSESAASAAVDTFSEAVEAEMRANGGDRRGAIAKVSRTQPNLHKLYLKGVNRHLPVAATL